MTGRIYVGRYLTALDGYMVPIRIGSYALDSVFQIGAPFHNYLTLIRDAISNRDSYIGGTVEKGESLIEALFGECAEEGGLQYDPVIVHRKVTAILSLDTPDRFNRLNDQMLILDPEEKVYRPAEVNPNYRHGRHMSELEVIQPIPERQETFCLGGTFKLRNIFRTKSTVPPEQQPARHDETLPEAVNPRYDLIMPSTAEYKILRPSFCAAIKIADKFDALYSLLGRKEVEPDLNDLATQWESYNIHPAYIEILCKRRSSLAAALEEYEKANEKMGLGENATITALIKNLQITEIGLHDILRHKLPHEAEIREMLRIIKS